MIVTIAQCLCQKHERGQAPTAAMKSPASKARLRLIESIIDECVIAPNVHKRVLRKDDIDQHINASREQQGDTPL